MRGWSGRWVALALVLAVGGLAAVAIVLVPGSQPDPAAVDKASTDSEAPAGAPAHWLPPEDWVYNHWLPYDEGRLHSLLGVTRGAIWRQLRDDRRNLAQLAARRGWSDPDRLAAALVAPRARSVSPAVLAGLRERALRTLTQGHLAQHLLFHSLHQFAIPSEAPAIFGVTDAAFRQLRRSEQSPLEIGRLHGRAPSQIQSRAAAVLVERVRHGRRSGAMTERQGRLLLRRQLSQLPRWLAQVRYNGPPPTHRGRLTGRPRDFAANPALSAGGGRVVFESYAQKLDRALDRGEISVRSRALDGGPAREASFNARRRTPRSAYNPSVSADGRVVAFEAAEGNQNFAKRYGQIRVLVNDAATGRTHTLPLPRADPGVSRSQYNPAISADGRHVAYEGQRRDGASAIYVTDRRRARTTLLDAGQGSVREPAISGDGSRIAFVRTERGREGADRRGRSQIAVRDVGSATTTLVSRAGGKRGALADEDAADPVISRDGRHVAFASTAGNLEEGRERSGSRIYVRDLASGATTAVSPARSFALKPAISGDGRTVAYIVIADGGPAVAVRDARGRGPERRVSRASGAGGAPADRGSGDVAISADGRRVAFTSAATNLSPGKPDDRRGVFVRDLRSHATTLVSEPVRERAVKRPGAAVANARPAPAAGTARPEGGSARRPVVAIFDNAFFRGRERPTVRLRAGSELTWRWSSRQSHQVTAVAGPRPVRSETRTAGRHSVRLTRPGVYRFVCSIHAPGMRMAAVVR